MAIKKKEVALTENIEAFAEVVDALLANPGTRKDFEKKPIKVLEKHGIIFPNEEVAKRIEKGLIEAIPQIAPGDELGWTNPAVKVATKSTSPVVSVVVNVASQAMKLPDDIMEIDELPVRMLRETAKLETRIQELEKEVAMLRNLKR